MKYAVGIDVGGTNTRVALINEEYKILERIQFSTDSKDPEVTLNKIGEIIKEFGKEVEGIGISCPGPLDLIEGVVLTPPNLPGWHHLALSKRLDGASARRQHAARVLRQPHLTGEKCVKFVSKPAPNCKNCGAFVAIAITLRYNEDTTPVWRRMRRHLQRIYCQNKRGVYYGF